MAFSNADGGVVLLGVSDDGAPRGRQLDAGTEDAVHEALASASDIGRYELSALDVDGVGITVLSVSRRIEGFAQTSNGRVLVRRGSRDDPLFGAELQRFINERSHTRFEMTVTDVAVAAASPRLLGRLAVCVRLERRSTARAPTRRARPRN